MAKKKLVFIMNNFWIGGVERLLFDLIAELHTTYQLEIITVLGSGPLESEFSKIPVRVYHASPISFSNKKFLSKLLWLLVTPITFIRLVFFLVKVKPDIIVTSLYQADIFGVLGAWLCGVKKRILIQHDVKKFGFFRKHLKFLFAINLTTHIIAVSSTVQKFLISYWHISQNKTTLIYNGINIEKFKNATKQLNEKEIILGIIGRLEPVKGHIYLLQALKILKDKDGIEPKVIVVGGGTLALDLKEYTKTNSLQRVEFAGPVIDSLQFFKSIDILIVPSEEEGFGLVVLEGLVAGKVVIASDINAFKELIVSSKTGVLFQNKNIQSLASALQSFILEPELIERYHKNIEIWMREVGYEYDIKKIVAKYKKLF